MKLNFWKKDSTSEGVEGAISSSLVEPSIGIMETKNLESPPDDSIYNKITFWSLAFLAVGLLIFFLPLSTNVLEINKNFILLLCVGVALVSWLLGIVSSGWLSWRKNYLDYGILALLLATAIGTVFSIRPIQSLFGGNLALSGSLVTMISLSVYYLLVVNTTFNRGSFFRSLFGLSIIVTLFYGLLQILGLHVFRFDFSVTRAFNTVGSINTLGVLAAISLPFLNRTNFSIKRLNNAHLDKIGTVLAVAILLIINWQTLWIVAIAGMVGLVVFDSMKGEKFKVSKIVLPMLVIVLGVFMMIVNLNLGNIRDKFPTEISPSFSLSGSVILETLKEKPIFGYGPENFDLAFDKHGASRLANTSLSGVRFFDGVSEFSNLIVQSGVVGLAAFIFLLWCVIKMIIVFRDYCAKYSGSDFLKEDTGVFSSLISAIVAFFFYPFSLSLMFVFFTLLALAAVISWNKELKSYNIELKTSLSLVSSLAFIGGLILALVGGYFGSTYYLADVKYAKAIAQDDSQEAASLLVSAINLNGNDDRYYRSASQVALNLLSAELNNPSQGSTQERNQRIQNYVSSAVTLAQRATQISPDNSVNWVNLGNVYQNLLAVVDSADRLSEEAYLKASELRPGDANYFNRIGMLYLSKYELLRQLAPSVRGTALQNLINQANDAIVKSEENFKKAIEIAPNFGVAIYNLGAVYDRQNKVNEAVGELEKIITANPNQPGLNFELGLLYYRAERKTEALQQLEQAILLAPDYSNARWYAALIYEEQGNFEKAIEYLEHVLNIETNKDNQVLKDKLTQLREGRQSVPPLDVIEQEPLQ